MKHRMLLLLLLAGFRVIAQKEDQPEVTNVTVLDFLPTGISHEHRIGRFESIYTQAYLRISGSASYSSNLGSQVSFYLDPALAVQLRHYYNGARRADKGKRTDKNSMNYIAFAQEAFLSRMPLGDYPEEPRRRLVYTPGLIWGLQRNYLRRFSLDFNIGAGYLLSSRTRTGYFIDDTQRLPIQQFTLISNLSLGIWLGK